MPSDKCLCGLFLIIVLILAMLSGYIAYIYYGRLTTENLYYKISFILNAFKHNSSFQSNTNAVVLLSLLFNAIFMNQLVFVLMPHLLLDADSSDASLSHPFILGKVLKLFQKLEKFSFRND